MENCLIFYDVEFYVLSLILEGISETLGEVNELLFRGKWLALSLMNLA